MIIENTNIAEVRELCQSLTGAERRYYDIDCERTLKKAIYVCGVRDNDKLVGMGGILSEYRILYSTFYMIKSEYQGKGFGTYLKLNNNKFAQQHGFPLLLTIVRSNNIPAVCMARSARCALDDKGEKYLYVSFNRLGLLVGVALPLMLKMYLGVREEWTYVQRFLHLQEITR